MIYNRTLTRSPPGPPPPHHQCQGPQTRKRGQGPSLYHTRPPPTISCPQHQDEHFGPGVKPEKSRHQKGHENTKAATHTLTRSTFQGMSTNRVCLQSRVSSLETREGRNEAAGAKTMSGQAWGSLHGAGDTAGLPAGGLAASEWDAQDLCRGVGRWGALAQPRAVPFQVGMRERAEACPSHPPRLAQCYNGHEQFLLPRKSH